MGAIQAANSAARRRVDLSKDEGFSLTELAVYILVFGVLAAIVAMSVLSLFRTESTVSSLTNSASESQIFVSVLNQDLRSAREVAVRDEGSRVVLSVAGDSTPITWECVTWQVTGTAGDQSIARNGAVLLEHVRANGENPFFVTASGADLPQGKEGTLHYNLRAATSESGIVNVEGVVSNEAQGQLGAPAHCI